MSHLSLSFFGGFHVALDGQPVTAFSSDKTRALLAFLAVEYTRSHSRSALACMFWPDLPEQKAAHNLSQTLLRLRAAIREGQTGGFAPGAVPFLLVTHQEVRINPLGNFRLDVSEFTTLLRARQEHHPNNLSGVAFCSECTHRLEQAVELYGGELLAGFFVRDTPAFEEWRLVQKEALQMLAADALAQLASLYEQRGDYDRVLKHARRLVTLDPWNENAHIQIMRALAVRGQKAAALEHYELYRRALAEDLGVESSDAAASLFQQIRMGGMLRLAEPAAAGDSAVPSMQAERRQITVLICGRRPKPAGRDPEDLYHQVVACKSQCQNIINRFGGTMFQRQGEECQIYYGYPQAYEDSARRAVHAGLAMAAADPADPVEVGIHTGLMVMGEKHGRRLQDRELVGDVPELARACQRQAGPGAVLVSTETERLVQGWFDFTDLSQLVAPGQGDPAPARMYRVERESALPDPFDVLARSSLLAPFAGRERELAMLTGRYRQMLAGQGQMALVRGEPGVGKSRLLWEFKNRTRALGEDLSAPGEPEVLWLEVHCSPYYQNVSLYPAMDLLGQILGFQPGDSPQVRVQKLAAVQAQFPPENPDAFRSLSLMLGLPLDPPLPDTTLLLQRELMRSVMVELVLKRFARQPVVLMIEDLQWSDPSSIEWLIYFLQLLAPVRYLVLLTARASFNPPWLSKTALSVLDLAPLTFEEGAWMASEMARPRRIPPERIEAAIARSDGNPFFLEELVRSLILSPKQAPGMQDSPEIPVGLRDSLAARLDYLGPARETAQWASVIGSRFNYPLLQAVAPFDPLRLQHDLDTLVEADVVFPLGEEPYKEYAFRHVLLREAAYSSLLRRTRRDFHARVVAALETNFARLAQSDPDLLAYHTAQAADGMLCPETVRAGGKTPPARTTTPSSPC